MVNPLYQEVTRSRPIVKLFMATYLVKSGLREVMLIGDPEQAIFEWRDAQPSLLEAKYTEWKANSLVLDENWRSSQRICNFFHRMSALRDAPKAVNPEVSLCENAPQIWTYQGDEYGTVVDKFVATCADGGVSLQAQNVAVLPRSKDIVKSILGDRQAKNGKGPWRDTQGDITPAVCEARYAFEQRECRRAMDILARAVYTKRRQTHYCTVEDLKAFADEYGYIEWRKDLYQVLKALPGTNYPLGEWVERANASLNSGWLIEPGDLSIKMGKNKSIYAQMDMQTLFMRSETHSTSRPYRVGTIHSAKGETIDAVLVVLKAHAGDKHKYEQMLKQPIIENEELRIVYVGITRAKRILVLAVPEASRKAWEQKFFGQ